MKARIAAAAAAVTLVAAGATALTARSSEPSSTIKASYSATDERFLRQFAALAGGGQADEVDHFRSVREAARGSSAVVVGRVTRIAVTRVLVGDGSDRVPMVGLTVEPSRVIRGALIGGASGGVVVEFAGTEEFAAQVRAGRAAPVLPTGKAVWFLHAKADGARKAIAAAAAAGREISEADRRTFAVEAAFYRLSSSQGLFVQGPGSVVHPGGHDAADGDVPDPFLAEVERMRDLGQLIEAIAAD